jgi:hypothetical protein
MPLLPSTAQLAAVLASQEASRSNSGSSVAFECPPRFTMFLGFVLVLLLVILLVLLLVGACLIL